MLPLHQQSYRWVPLNLALFTVSVLKVDITYYALATSHASYTGGLLLTNILRFVLYLTDTKHPAFRSWVD